MRFRFFTIFFVVVCLTVFMAEKTLSQQNLPQLLRVSPQAEVSQNISFVKVTINYSRPGVKGREIYGKLVPYGLAPNAFGNGKAMPWRAGANENTTISFSNEVKINGNTLPAGIYGLHMIVQEDEWTIIFSKDHTSWGSFFYEDRDDALRIKVKPQTADFEEWLVYGFSNLTSNSADAYLHWGKIKVSFKIEIDEHKVVLDTYRQSLMTLPGFNQAAWGAAAKYCLDNNINLDEAMTWVDKALAMNGGNNFANTSVKAGLLTAQGKADEGDKLLEASMSTATETELNNYGYQLMGQNKIDDAIEIFKLNIKNHPESWNVYDSLGEALANKGDKKGAKEYYEKAYDMAPGGQKSRIEGILKGL